MVDEVEEYRSGGRKGRGKRPEEKDKPEDSKGSKASFIPKYRGLDSRSPVAAIHCPDEEYKSNDGTLKKRGGTARTFCLTCRENNILLDLQPEIQTRMRHR